ncbi:NAD(P)-binding domain-containing protein [Aestuariibaculum suncheonense]|uniref:NAD(P)H-binding protein n=1 Tax=Aestuariibaculum suncheonense TaxID=1028745 RepID=A0A8J6Q7Y2_9FLAO|nr:NAD(P)-binding domain-containing protein [Aestuariibaculum suncheonense]MBD0835849.1 NAD(P)H-binding protein [Aestuariibaculum suncheonense]
MRQSISILGCGWLGLALASDLTAKGYEVYGSTTSVSKIEHLEEKGIKSFLIDISKPDLDIIRDFLSSKVLVIAITSKSIDDIKNLIKHIEVSEVQNVIFISSTSVYPFTNGIVTENTNTLSTPLAEIEQLFISNPSFKSTIIRFGGLFGYDRKPGNFVKDNKPVEYPDGYVNLIHRDDCIEIIEQVIFKNVWNEILNACADSHPKRRDFYLRESQKTGKSQIVFNEATESKYKIINSQKLKRLLDYKFIHADLMNLV